MSYFMCAISICKFTSLREYLHTKLFASQHLFSWKKNSKMSETVYTKTKNLEPQNILTKLNVQAFIYK